MAKLLCIGQVSLATTVRGTITVQIPRVMRPWRISLTGRVTATAVAMLATEIAVRMISCGGDVLVFNGGAVDGDWSGFINCEGAAWDLTVDYGDDLADVPTCSGDAGLVLEVVNNNAATSLLTCYAAMMD